MKNEQENAEEGLKSSYESYQSMGGVINEKDYQSALDRAKNTLMLDNKSLILQAESIAKKSGIVLYNSDGVLDQKLILYGILRTDNNPGEQYHHSTMGDQRLFAEALRMLGDEDSLKKLIEAYPNIFDERN